MGYFSNGTEGECYEAAYCARCIHGPRANPDRPCTVWMLHLLYAYEDCNKPESYLNDLIPRTDDRVGNEQCTMFIEAPDLPDPRQGGLGL